MTDCSISRGAKIAIHLLKEVRWLHRQKDENDYNECEISECCFCEEADEAIALLSPLVARGEQ